MPRKGRAWTPGEDPDDPFDGPVEVPIEESLDLHHFAPGEVIEILDAYLDAAKERGFRELCLIHGRGKGVLRNRVQRWLARDPRVDSFADAPGERGGWGATLVRLREGP